mmetsp:Transcript_15680/g.20343  ORF Transcript_15680/g.20343 Transcript_15680/m.20343 type:complete len:223 (-) Transcript_15680:1499-2167(-)
MQPPDSRSPKIGAVVSQAKETASALWVLLHARQCTDDQCRLIHCANAKGIFSLSRAASTGVKLNDHQSAAVAEARKLLLHFKECRQSRLTTNAEEEDEETSTLQASSSSSSENPPQRPSPPVCLVCSLVARARPATQTTTTGTVAGENILLDFSNSPYDVKLFFHFSSLFFETSSFIHSFIRKIINFHCFCFIALSSFTFVASSTSWSWHTLWRSETRIKSK